MEFTLREAGNAKAPPGLPLSHRGADITNRKDGPTIEDYYTMANYQTPLFSDDCPPYETTSTPRPSRRGRHDPQFFNAQDPGSNAYLSLPEFVTGLWEGVYMVSTFEGSNPIRTLRLILEYNQVSCSSKEVPLPDTQDFICKMPLQCLLDLYFYFGSQDSVVPGCIADEVSQWSVTPKDFSTATVSACQCKHLNCS